MSLQTVFSEGRRMTYEKPTIVVVSVDSVWCQGSVESTSGSGGSNETPVINLWDKI